MNAHKSPIFFCFFIGYTLFGNIWFQNSKSFDTKNNSNIQNSMWKFTFSVFDRKYCFWENLVQKLKIVILSLNFIHFSVFDLKYPFWANLVQKSKIVSLSWNSVQILIIWICRIWRWFSSLFSFETRNILLVQIWSKRSKLSVWAET